MTDPEVKLPPIPKYITELIDGYLADDSGNVSETKLRNVQKVMLAFARAAVLADRENRVAHVGPSLSQTVPDPLRSAAEQFLASCKDGNVCDLIEYYEEIFSEALGSNE